ncbi:CHASE2 domain-containing protein [Rhodocytophaga rosea]|uniref:CHASE2 domain-containing protein n=1 Tax=Rhodocytophaga rosea TaxID=2704465 RepID=A0A6C0GL48_9BACT|nr:CHASE2 domain-containing protein [Rhodocytophaga rosea]QHT68370.1 CHASE2 domain-containing protein [Rhodocytophaga rosea]
MKKNVLLITACLAHSLLLLAFTYIELKSPYTTGEELTMLQLTSGLKRKVFLRKEKPSPDRFLFISVSWDKKLVEKKDEYDTPVGQQPITDRSKIADFLQILNQKPDNHKFITLDIFFEDSTTGQPQDDIRLAAELARTKNLLIPYHMGDSSQPNYPIFKAPLGLADYEPTVEGLLIKFSIVNSQGHKTMPLLMYENVSGKEFKPGMIVDELGGKPVLSSFILDHRIFQEDVMAPNAPLYHKLYLNELLKLDPEYIHDFTKDKIIIIGDLDNRVDMHKTIYGDMLGPVILLNAFLALENGDNQITWYFLLFLLCSYMLISYVCFKQVDILEGWLFRWLPKWLAIPGYVKEMMESFASYLLYFGLLSIMSYMLFNFHLTIFLISIYMQVLEWIIKNIRRRVEQSETVIKSAQ